MISASCFLQQATAGEPIATGDWNALVERLNAAEQRLEQVESSTVSPISNASLPNYQLGTDVDRRLRALETGYRDVKTAALLKKAAAKEPDTTMKIFGRIHADYWGYPYDSGDIDQIAQKVGTGPENHLLFRRVRIGVSGKIRDNMLYKAEYDFADPADPAFKDVYLGWSDLPIFQTVLLGNQKRPLGMDHLNSSRYNWFMERPLIIEAFNSDARRFGLASYGYSDNLLWNWRYGGYFLENISKDGEYYGNNAQMSFNARLASTPWYDEASDGRGYFHWAVAYMGAQPDGNPSPNDTNSNEARFATRPEARTSKSFFDTGPIAGASWYNIAALEAMGTFGPLSIVGEYQHMWLSRDNDADLQFDGYYVAVGYFLTGEHQPFDRKTGCIGRVKPFENFWLVDTCDDGVRAGWGAWQVAARFSVMDLNDDAGAVPVHGGHGRFVTFGLNWWWNSHARMQFNYIYGDIRDDDVKNSAGATIFADADATFTSIGTRFMVDF